MSFCTRISRLRNAMPVLASALVVLMTFGTSLAGPMAYVPDATTGKVAIIDTAAGAKVGEIVTGRDPRGVAIHPSGKTLYLGNFEGKSLSVFDAQTLQEKANLALGGLVQGVAIKPDGSRVYVANGNYVSVIDTATNAVIATVPTAGTPRGILVARNGQYVYTSNYLSGKFSILDSTANTIVATLTLSSTSQPYGMAENPVSRMVYVTGYATNRLYVIDPVKRSLVKSIAVGYRPIAVAFSPDNKYAYVCNAGGSSQTPASISIVDTASNSVVARVNISPSNLYLTGIGVHPDGSKAYLISNSTGEVLVVDLTSKTVVAKIPAAGHPLAIGDFIAKPVLSVGRLAPENQSLLNRNLPTFNICPATECLGQSCSLSDEYFKLLAINAKIEGVSAPPFTFDVAQRCFSYTPTATLAEGPHKFSVQLTDAFGARAESDSTFTVDVTPPLFVSVSPANNTEFQTPLVTVSGQLSDTSATVTLGGTIQHVKADGTFSVDTTLAPGQNTLTLSAIDAAANSTSTTLNLTYRIPPPMAPNMSKVVLGLPTAGKVTVTGSAGAAAPNLKVVITNMRTQDAVTGQADSASAFQVTVAAQAGDKLAIALKDDYGSIGPAEIAVVPGTIDGDGVVPDPATVATPVNPGQPTVFADSTAFLYSGSNPVQLGVAPGVIESRRVAVIRGKVLDRTGNALQGVRISVLGHPELGYSFSRPDGMFDFAVNGGGVLTLVYEKAGLLAVQRQLKTPWQEYLWAPEVRLLALDSQVTTIDLTVPAAMQVAKGSSVSDVDGSRQAVVMVPQGTTANVILPNGSTQAITAASIRATEFTVGAAGNSAMPGDLPANSGYTYAVELSVDEAMALGAKEVRFNQPLPVYVDNFLGFAVGEIVPSGYYDRDKATWIASDNGRVIKVLSIDQGLASLDIAGSGTAADQTALAQLGVSDAERAQLATLYAPGKTLWRVPVVHFTPYDFNWPHGPPDGSTPPAGCDGGNCCKDKKENSPCQEKGSIIECENRILGERIPVAGTSFSLNYRSDRVPGRQIARTLSIPLTPGSIHPDLKRVVVEITVAGRSYIQSYPKQANLNHEFVWDGKDAYGREIFGLQPAKVRIGYVFPIVYKVPADVAASFGSYPRAAGGVILGRTEITLWNESNSLIGTDTRNQGLGGWSLDVLHAYDLASGSLLLGDGRRRANGSLNNVMGTIAGTGEYYSTGDGGVATNAATNQPYGLAVDPAGNVFVAEYSGSRIRKIDANGVISSVAGVTDYTGTIDYGYSGDGGAASRAKLNGPLSLALDAANNLYFSDTVNYRVRKIAPNGIITTFAGNGTPGSSGDGGLATAAQVDPDGVAVDASGNVYIVDGQYCRVRKVDLNGVISTVAGKGTCGYSGDGGPASSAELRGPTYLAIDSRGNLYIAEQYRIRKVGIDGVISTIAGTGVNGFSGDGGLATAAKIGNYLSIAVDRFDRLFIADLRAYRVRMVGSDGTINTVAGNGSYNNDKDGGLATASAVGCPSGIAFDAQNNLYFTDTCDNRVRKIALLMAPKIANGEVAVAEESGTDLYIFNSSGRHLRTVNARNNAVRYAFNYDAAGLLTQIQDGNGNVTTVERDATGKPKAIVSPDNQRTELALNADGYLASVTSPALESYLIGYGSGGLLTSFTNPRSHKSTLAYDSDGRLSSDQNAAGGGWTLQSSEFASGRTVTLFSAEGRSKLHRWETLLDGTVRRTYTAPDSTSSVQDEVRNGTTVSTRAYGTVTTTELAADPRFGMHAPYLKRMTIKQPSGLTYNASTLRTLTLANSLDPTSLQTLLDTDTINGKVFKTQYSATQQQYTTTSPLGRQATLKVDPLDRPLLEHISGIEDVTYAYDARGRLSSVKQGTGAALRQTSYSYDSAGYLASMTDAAGRLTRYQRDLAGRVTTLQLPDGLEVQYSYDANGNTTSITPPTRPVHVFDYDAIDQETRYTPPALGAASVVTRNAYNLDRQLTSATRPDGQVVGYGYDAAGRLGAITIPNGSTTYSYASGTGQLSGISAPGNFGLNFSYNGDLLTSEQWSGGIVGSVSYGYDAFFRVNQQGINGSNLGFAYDDDGLLIQAGTLTLTHDPANGLMTGTTLDTISTTQQYNAFGELASYVVKQGSTTLFSESYTRDNLGRISSKQVVDSTGSHSYAYDYQPSNGRLTAVRKDGTTIGSYQYDANGNRTQSGSKLASYDDQDRLSTYDGATYSYTANGELQQVNGAGSTTYAYDVLGNLRQANLPDGTRLDYLIDGRNRRIGKQVNGVTVQGWLYQGPLNPVAELDGNNQIVNRFVYGSRSNVPDYLIKGGQTYRIVIDQLGSVRLVIDSQTGAIAQRIDYDEYGIVTLDTNPGFQPFGFAGGLYDQHTKLTRFGARDYDALTGRWTAKDPIRFGGGDANIYAYVLGDPVNLSDPSGLLPYDAVPQSKIQDAQSLLSRLTNNSLTPQQMDTLTRATITELGPFEGARLLSVDLKGDQIILSPKQADIVNDIMNRMLKDPNISDATKELVRKAKEAYEVAKKNGICKIQ